MVRFWVRWSSCWFLVCAVALGLQPVALSAGFEEGILLTDQSVREIGDLPADQGIDIPVESVLVPPVAEAMEDRVVEEAVDSVAISDEVPGCCASCAGGGCRECLSPEGTINRTLLPVAPRWEAQVDALMLWQGNIPGRVLYVDGATGAPVLDANQAQPAMAAGPRYGLFLNLDPVYTIEGNYFNVQSFAGQAATPAGVYGQNNLAGPSVGPADGINFTSAQVLTSASIQSAELNWRRRTCGPVTWLAGFRWVEWNQQMQVNDSFDIVNPLPPPDTFPGTSRLQADTGNNLYGGQLGMDLSLWSRKSGFIKVNGVGKAGVFYNHAAYQRTSGTLTYEGLDPIPLGPASAKADQTAFFGELGVNASVRLTSWLSWRAGYTLFWLSGVATPAAQLSQTDIFVDPAVAAIDTNGSVLLHGVTTGLEARW